MLGVRRGGVAESSPIATPCRRRAGREARSARAHGERGPGTELAAAGYMEIDLVCGMEVDPTDRPAEAG
jgi:hypothetical protein